MSVKSRVAPLHFNTSFKTYVSVDGGFDLTKQEIPLTLKAAVYGKCKQLECLHLQAYK